MALEQTIISSVAPASPPTTSLTIIWSAVSGAEQYLVTRIFGDTSVIRYFGTDTSFTDTNLQPDTEYCYTVKCISDCSESVSAMECGTTDCTTVQTPSAPSVIASGETVTIDWTEFGLIFSFSVERSLDDNNWTELESGLTDTIFVDTTVSYGNCYYYRIAATGCTKEYSPSTYVCVSCSLPDAVPWLIATPVSDIEIDLAWGDAPGATEYRIYRDGVLIDTVSTQTYEDIGLEPDTEYDYCVTSENDCGVVAGCP